MIKIILAAFLAVSIGAVITPHYTMKVYTKPGAVGEKGMAGAIITPADRYKWNKEYPASFEFMHYEPNIATPIRGETHFKDGKLCVPYIGKQAGREPIVVAINFSVCNKEECLTYRNEKVILMLIVKNIEKNN